MPMRRGELFVGRNPGALAAHAVDQTRDAAPAEGHYRHGNWEEQAPKLDTLAWAAVGGGA